MSGAFLFGGGFWLIVLLTVVVGALYYAAEHAPYDTDLWEDGEDGFYAAADERRTRTTLYPRRPDRHVDEVVPLRKVERTDEWQ